MPRKSIGVSRMPVARQHLVDETLAREQQAHGEGAENLVHPIGHDQGQHQQAHLLDRAGLRHVIGERIADGEIQDRDRDGGDDREDESPHMRIVDRAVGRLNEEGLVLFKRQIVFRPAALHGGQLRMEALLHHVEIGQHDQEQRPESDEHNEDDSQCRAVALEEALAGGIMSKPRFITRHQPEDGDDDDRDDEYEKPTHAPSSLRAG